MKQSRNSLLAAALLGALGFLQIGNRAHAAVSLSEALDAPSLSWSTVGTPAWEGQSILSSDGVDAAMSGVVADGTAVTIQTTVTGPGTVSFWWKVSSELTNDYLKFFISGYQQVRISGEVDWQQQTFNVPAGSQTLKWTYSKNATGSAGLDRGWVDRVQFVTASNCTFSVSPTSPLHGAGPAIGSVTVAATAGCPWSIFNSNTWVDIPTGVINLGSGTVTYALSTNEGPVARHANLNIAGQLVAITQDPAPSGALSVTAPSGQSVAVGGTATFSVTATGSASLAYQWQFNGADLPNGAFISGATTPTLTIANAQLANAGAYRVQVAGGGGVVVSPAAMLVVGNPISLPQALDTDATNLVWTTTGTVPWTGQSAINHDGVDAAQSGAISDSSSSSIQTVVTGPGTLSFWWKVSSEANSDRLRLYVNGSESANISGEVNWAQRSIVLASGPQLVEWRYTKNSAISAGQDRGWVDQVQFTSSAACTFALSATSASHGAGSSTGLVSVTAVAGCAWNVLNTNAWVAIKSGASGSGDGLIKYVLMENPAGNRAGSITIAGQTFTINQLGAVIGCSYAVSPSTRTHGYGFATNSFSVVTPDDCTWTVVNSNVWLTVSGLPTGSGNATIAYSVAPNPTTQVRTGIVSVAGQIVLIMQLGVPCNYALSPASRDHGAEAASGAINVTTALPCTWNASTTNSWITILPGTNNVGTGIVNYTLSANTNAPRTGIILIGSQSFIIHQDGSAGPSVTLVHQSNGDVTLSFSGILQSAATVKGTFVDVAGTPQGTYTIQKGSLELKRFFRARTP